MSANDTRHRQYIDAWLAADVPDRSMTNVRRTILKDLLHDRFDCSTPYEEMAIIIDSIIRKKRNVPAELSKTFNDIIAISTASVEGNVLSSGFQHSDKMVIIKYNKPGQDIMNLVHEFVVGKALNYFRALNPCFMYVYSMIDCNALPNISQGAQATMCPSGQGVLSRHLITEHIDGKPLADFLKTETYTVPELKKLYRAIFLAMHVANEQVGFCHYDFHSGNVLVRKLKRPMTLTFFLEDGTVNINTRFVPTVIDYGFARIKDGQNVYHREVTFPIAGRVDALKENFPIIDFYKLLSHSVWELCSSSRMTQPVAQMFGQVMTAAMGDVGQQDLQDVADMISAALHNNQVPNAPSTTFYYPKQPIAATNFLTIANYFGADNDKQISQPICNPGKIKSLIYGVDKNGTILHEPCNGENMPSKDVWGNERSLFDCAKYFFDGQFNVIEIPKGTKLYHGSAALAFFNAKDPYGVNYYKRDTLLTAEERKDLQGGVRVDSIMKRVQPIDLTFYGDISIARTYSNEGKVNAGDFEFRCGRNCTHAYVVTKNIKIVDMSDPFNLKTIASICPPQVQFLLALYHGQPFSHGSVPLNPGNEQDIRHWLSCMTDQSTYIRAGIYAAIQAGVREWMNRFGDLAANPNLDAQAAALVRFNRNNPVRRFSAFDLDRYSMRFPDYMLPKFLMDNFEKNGYQGYGYLPTPRRGSNDYRFGEVVLRNAGPTHLKRDLSNPYDWQYIDDQYLFGEIGKLIRDMSKYKTTNIDFHAGDLIQHSVWAAMYMQMMFRDNHPAIQGLPAEMRSLLVATAFLHDIGKGGDMVFVFYDKKDHPSAGAAMIDERKYTTDKGVINLDDVFSEMGIPSDKIPLVRFLVRYHWDIGEVLREHQNVDGACIEAMYARFVKMCQDSGMAVNKTTYGTVFACLYAIWTADLMATQPYIARDKMRKLAQKIAQDPNYAASYFNATLDDLPNISNLPKVHGGRDMYKVLNIQARGIPLRQGVLALIQARIA